MIFLLFLLLLTRRFSCVVTAHNNDEQYIESKKERSRERDTDLTWFDNLPTSIERRLLF
jgi:hypothetical protein